MASLAFQVKRCKPELIKPAKPTPHETKMLSDIDDQEHFRFQFPVIMSYNDNPSVSKQNVDVVEVIRDSLSRALEFYYPFAGRLWEGSNRKLMVDCHEQGILFVEANADVKLEELGDAIRPPCPLLNEFLSEVPGSDGILGCPLLLVQVTRLRCGGFIFALRLNHAMSDGPGLVQFLNAVSEMARGKDAPSILPVWKREILYARNPPRITCMHYEYEDIIEDSNHDPFAATVQQSFYFGPKEVDALLKQLPPHSFSRSSKFDLIAACLWKCRTVALEFSPKQIVRMSCSVNARGKHDNVPIPLGYYGSAFSNPAAISEAEKLCKNPLGYAIELLTEAKAKMNEEYIRSVADFMVIRGRPLNTALNGNFIVSDTRHAGFEKVDFGWGKPEYAGPAKALGSISFVVQHKKENELDGISVPICLPLWSMERFQYEFKKMTLSEKLEDLNNMRPTDDLISLVQLKSML